MSIEKQLAKAERELTDLLRKQQEATDAYDAEFDAVEAYSRRRQEKNHSSYIEQQQQAEEAYDAKTSAIRLDHKQNLADAMTKRTAAVEELKTRHAEYLLGVESLTSETNRKRQTIAAIHAKRLNETNANYQAVLVAFNTAQRQAEKALTGRSIQPLPANSALLKGLIATLQLPLADLADREITLRENLIELDAANQADQQKLEREHQKRVAEQHVIMTEIDKARKDAKNTLEAVRSITGRITSAKLERTNTPVNVADVGEALRQIRACKAEGNRLWMESDRLAVEWESIKRRRRWGALMVMISLLALLLAAYAVITGLR